MAARTCFFAIDCWEKRAGYQSAEVDFRVIGAVRISHYLGAHGNLSFSSMSSNFVAGDVYDEPDSSLRSEIVLQRLTKQERGKD